MSDDLGGLKKRIEELERKVERAAFIREYEFRGGLYAPFEVYEIDVATVVQAMAGHLGFSFDKRRATERGLCVTAPAKE